MSRKIVLLMCIVLLLGLAGNASAVLRGWWRLNDGSGSTAADSSGNGYNGTITGAAWVNDGTRGYVLDFEGADYISIPSTAVSLTSTVTIAVWQYGDVALQPQNNSIFEGTRSGSRTLNAHIPWGNGSLVWDAGYAGTTYDRVNKTATNANQYEGQWNHWAFTKDTSSGQMKMYLNGTIWTSGTGKTKSMSGINLFKIGSAAAGTSNYDGMISDFRVYNTVLTETEIRVLAGWTNTISGTVGTVDGVTMGGLPGSPVTSGGGNYTATVQYGWSGTATPSKAGYTFSPTNKTYSNVTVNQTAQNYTPTLLTRVIYGTVLDVDFIYDMSSVTMSGLPGSPVTDSDGYYTATVGYGWSGTVTPSRTGFTFAPANRTYSNVTVDQNSPYDGTIIRHTLSGTIGTVGGVLLEDLPGSPTTDDSGFYTCYTDYGWTGTATPEREGYTFSPVNKTYSNIISDQTAQNYTPIINTYTISGHVGSLDGVTMNGLPGNPSTSGGGAYSATVTYGWAGTVTPAKAGYVFDNVYKVYSDISGDQTNQDYTPHQTALDLNMLGWWNFDGSNANDSSGYGRNGTLTGNANIVDDSERGKVLHLDGNGDYVTLGNGSWTNPGNHVTIAAWIKVANFDVSYQAVVTKGDSTYRLHRSSTTNYMAAGMNYTSSNSMTVSGTTSVNDGKWHLTAVTYDGTTMKLYIDGALESTNTLSTLYTNTASLMIGRNSDQTGRDWEGYIDSVRFYDKALTADEIADLYVSEGAGLIGWWKFDGNANDSSGLGHNGTLVGNVAIANDGERGQVLQVSTGADTTDNWVDCGGGAGDRNWATLGDKLSVMAWVKISSFTAATQYILSKGDSYIVSRYVSESKLKFKTGHWATANNLIGTETSNVADNNWHHVAAVYDGAQRYLYIDGYLDVFDNCTGMLSANGDNLLIGGYTEFDDRCWKGYIDDVKLFNKALSETDIRVEAGMLTAEDTTPADGATDVSVDPVLSWHAGPVADIVGGHNVYLGTSLDLVSSRDGSVFKGNQSETNYDPGTLAGLTTYYWAIDTVNDDYEDSPWAGDIWSFTTMSSTIAGHWVLNEGTGTTVADASGRGNTGTITGAAWVNDNVMGNVLDFEGVDYIAIPSAAFSTISTQITIALWQFGDAALQPQDNSIFEGTNSGSSRVLNSNLPWNTSIVYWDAGYAGGSYDRINKTATASQYEGKWNHWAFTKNTATGQMKIYLNGELWQSGTSKTKSMTGVTAFKIGSKADGTSNYDGMISDFRVYNVVLSDADILGLAGQYVATDPSPAHKTIDVEPYPTLTWKSGPLADQTDGHDLYLGTDVDLVAARDASVHVGLQDANSYSPSLKLATTYYWVVDEINGSDPRSPWKGDICKFTVRSSTEGYYKDIFFDGGVYITGYKAADIPACGMLGYTSEHVDTESMSFGQKIMGQTNAGAWQDDNAVLLYPDREPRFRMIFINGGDSNIHYDRLGTAAQNNVRDFYFNGGNYTGNCAGAWCVGFKRFDICPLGLGSANLGHTYVDGTIPDGKTSYQLYQGGNWVTKPPLPKSPFIDYYPEVFSDCKIHGLRENGGPCVNQLAGNFDDRAEALVLYDYSWSLRYDDPNANVRDLTVVGTAAQKGVHNKVMVWSWKDANGTTGKQVPCGTHPEHQQTYGEERYLQASIFRHAFSGFGKPTVKAALTSGVARQMNNNATAGHEKIGDKQYHHFTITVPQGATQLQIVLDGNLYDMNLYAKNSDFAFKNETGVVSATNSTGSDETLTIANPTAGTWYIGVKCNETVAATYANAAYNYTGRYEVLNGLAYTVTATVQQ